MDAEEFKERYGNVIEGDLDLRGIDIVSLPYELYIWGSLLLQDCPLETLPGRLVILGNLDLSGTNIIKMSPDTRVRKKLNLGNSKLLELPEYLSCGRLGLRDSRIRKLPGHLTIGSSLCLRHTEVCELSEYLTVLGHLTLSGSKVRELPRHLCVDGILQLINSKITKIPAYCEIGSGMEISSAGFIQRRTSDALRYQKNNITSIGHHTILHTHLDIDNTTLYYLPEYLAVDTLVVSHNTINNLPAHMKLGSLIIYKEAGRVEAQKDIKISELYIDGSDIRFHDRFGKNQIPTRIDEVTLKNVSMQKLPEGFSTH